MLDSSYLTPGANMHRILLIMVMTTAALAQSSAGKGEWRNYGGDLGNTHY